MKISKDKIMELVIAVPSVVGCYLVGLLNMAIQLTGWILFAIADLVGIYFCWKKKFTFLLVQYGFFLASTINAIAQRI